MTKLSYAEKLKDPRWQKLRLLAFDRDGFKCRVCNRADLSLQVHHKKYPESGNPWDAPLEDLVTVCEDHHKDIHANQTDKAPEQFTAFQKAIVEAKIANGSSQITDCIETVTRRYLAVCRWMENEIEPIRVRLFEQITKEAEAR